MSMNFKQSNTKTLIIIRLSKPKRKNSRKNRSKKGKIPENSHQKKEKFQKKNTDRHPCGSLPAMHC